MTKLRPIHPIKLYPFFRILTAALGIILITAALSKAVDMELSLRQIKDYGIITQRPALVMGTWILIAGEFALGFALLIFYRITIVLNLTSLIFLLFLGFTTWAWHAGTAEECGCFGAWLNRTPGQAAIENLVLLAFTVLAWLGLRKRENAGGSGKNIGLVTACAIGLILPLLFGFSPAEMSKPRWEKIEKELLHSKIEGLDTPAFQLGSHLIVLFDTECLQCQEDVVELNLMTQNKRMPRIIGLCPNRESQRLKFVETFKPDFPIGRIGEETFWRLMGEGDIPRMILLKEREIRRIWDRQLPEEEQIHAALTE